MNTPKAGDHVRVTLEGVVDWTNDDGLFHIQRGIYGYSVAPEGHVITSVEVLERPKPKSKFYPDGYPTEVTFANVPNGSIVEFCSPVRTWIGLKYSDDYWSFVGHEVHRTSQYLDELYTITKIIRQGKRVPA